MSRRLAPWLPLCVALAACGGVAPEPAPEPPPVSAAQFVPRVAHSWFPLTPGSTWSYEGEEGGLPRREEVRAGDPLRLAWDVECTPLVTEVSLDGELVEVTTEWYAEDRDGNVWKFGEESLELAEGTFGLTEDSWMAGRDGAIPWMAFAATPRVGDRWAGHSGTGQDTYVVESVTEVVVVPAGTFFDCAEVAENPDDPEDQDIILYAPDVGRVSETNTEGYVHLVRFAPAR